jgi:deoxycytidylate deaminase
VNGNVIISKAYNEIRHCSVSKSFVKFDESLHAERNACKKVDKERLVGATVYIYRETKNGHPALAYPCESCFSMLKSLLVKKIIFSTDTYPYYGEIRL